ncbi:MAG: transcriptional regulator [Oscillatoriales cyanobacterium CG2_30_40_61]|nr:MAG: transcriptional regulator [Oscillatoriales cyanobacterium CG2_30_40_61]
MVKTTDGITIINSLINDDADLQQMITESYINAEIGQLIYDTRIKEKVTAKELADIIGIQESVILDLEEGDYEGNALIILEKVAKVFQQRIQVQLISV